MQQLTEFVLNNLMLFIALLVVLLLLIKAELDNLANKGLLLSPSMATRLMNSQEDTLVIDLRAEAEYKKGHIKGAINIPLNSLAKKLPDLSADKNRPVLVYCNSGNTATSAIRMLKKAGFDKINNLEGGMLAWKEANMPLTRK